MHILHRVVPAQFQLVAHHANLAVQLHTGGAGEDPTGGEGTTAVEGGHTGSGGKDHRVGGAPGAGNVPAVGEGAVADMPQGTVDVGDGAFRTQGTEGKFGEVAEDLPAALLGGVGAGPLRDRHADTAHVEATGGGDDGTVGLEDHGGDGDAGVGGGGLQGAGVCHGQLGVQGGEAGVAGGGPLFGGDGEAGGGRQLLGAGVCRVAGGVIGRVAGCPGG